MEALPHIRPLIRKLESTATVSDAEKAALLRLPIQVRDMRPDQDIVRESDRPSQCCLVLEGFAASHKVRPSGKRQIMAFYIPGDIPDLQSLHVEVMDQTISTLCRCKVAFIPHPHLRELCREHPHLAEVFWRETLIDASIFREWIMCLGRRSATEHMAHLLCEFLARLKSVGLAQDHSFLFPVTQAELGDALGLTGVHVNRVLRDLRARDLIDWKRNTLTVLDWDGLVALGEFTPSYLHLTQARAA